MNAAMVNMPGGLPQGTTLRLKVDVGPAYSEDTFPVIKAGTIVKVDDDLAGTYIVHTYEHLQFVVETEEVEECEQSEWDALEEQDERSDPHNMIEEATHHPAECACAICVYGPDEWLRNFHASEY